MIHYKTKRLRDGAIMNIYSNVYEKQLFVSEMVENPLHKGSGFGHIERVKISEEEFQTLKKEFQS